MDRLCAYESASCNIHNNRTKLLTEYVHIMHIWTCFLLLQQDEPMPLRIEEEEQELEQEKADEEEEEDGEEEEKMSIQSSA